mgnify:CR=1 FL=1
MEERKDYAVLRFVDQNGWSYMVNDYAKGCSLMEYIKQGTRVEKKQYLTGSDSFQNSWNSIIVVEMRMRRMDM